MSEGTDRRARRSIWRWWAVLALIGLLVLFAHTLSLVKFGGPGEPGRRLPGFLEDWRSNERLKEIQKLSHRTDAKAIQHLLALTTDRNGNVRGRAEEALMRINDPGAVEPLVAALKDTRAGVRERAAEALGCVKGPRAVEPLVTALNDADPHVRWQAAWALGEIKDSRTVEPLIAALNDTNAHVRSNAALALAAITGVDCGEDAEKWQKWWDENKGSLADKPEDRK